MRIVHIATFYSPSLGGIETFTKELATRTSKLGHDVHVITYTARGGSNEDESSVQVHRVKPLITWYKARFSPRLRGLVKSLDPDIIHVHSPSPINQELLNFNGAGYIATYHNDPSLADRTSYKLSRWLYKAIVFPRFCSMVDRVIIPSSSFQRASDFLRLLPESKKRVIPNGVDTTLYSPPRGPKHPYKHRLGLDASTPTVLFVGGLGKLRSYKGVPVLLTALRTVRAPLQMVIVGDGDLRSTYEKMASTIANCKVRFIGAVKGSDLVDYYKATDFFVLPSTSVECCPIVVLEAMACGLPVIISDLPGPRDLVEDGKNGYRVPPGDASALSSIIGKMLAMDEEDRIVMSREARSRTVEKYSWDTVVGQYMSEYANLLSS